MAVAVERGHMVWFVAPHGDCTSVVARAAEAVLIEASRKGQLAEADLWEGEWSGWSVDAMAQLSAVDLMEPERVTVGTIVGAGAPAAQHALVCPVGSWSPLRDPAERL